MGSTVIILLKEVDYEPVLCLSQKAHSNCKIKHWLHASKDAKSHLFFEFLTFFCSILEYNEENRNKQSKTFNVSSMPKALKTPFQMI